MWLRDIVTVETSEGQPARLRGVMVDFTARKKEEIFHEGQRGVLEMIAADAPLADALKGIVDFIEPQSNGMLCSILLLDEDGVHVRHGAAPSLPGDYIRAINGAPIGPKAGSCGTAMHRGQRVIVTDILKDPLWEDYRALAGMFGLRACWSTPILTHSSKVLGSFAMYYHEPRSPKADELRLTAAATHLAGIAIERHYAGQALRRSEERYRRIVDTAYEGIWMIDEAEHHRIRQPAYGGNARLLGGRRCSGARPVILPTVSQPKSRMSGSSGAVPGSRSSSTSAFAIRTAQNSGGSSPQPRCGMTAISSADPWGW